MALSDLFSLWVQLTEFDVSNLLLMRSACFLETTHRSDARLLHPSIPPPAHLGLVNRSLGRQRPHYHAGGSSPNGYHVLSLQIGTAHGIRDSDRHTTFYPRLAQPLPDFHPVDLLATSVRHTRPKTFHFL